MIKSMTGFGKGEMSDKLGSFTVEIRTVNHRYFDVSSRMPAGLNQLEDKIKHYLHRYLKRGKINFSLVYKKGAKNIDLAKLDDEAIEKYYKMLNRVKKRFKLKDDIGFSHILSFPGVIIQEQPEYDTSSIWPRLECAIKKAVFDCNRMREREGRSLSRDLSKRISNISGDLRKISQLAPQLVAEHRRKLHSRINQILKKRDYDIDRSRLETELALFARQCDVSEELTRATSHLKALRTSLSSNKETGRRIDFILQELQREINTLGSKAGSVEISRLVVDIKSEIDKIREQVQNVE